MCLGFPCAPPQNGTKMAVGTLTIAAYKSNECQLHDAVDVTAKRKPNTKAAVSSIIVVGAWEPAGVRG